MTEEAPTPTYIRKARAMRIASDCSPVIALGMEDMQGDQYFFSIADATAYDLIRRMTSALFDDDADSLKCLFGDPSRSGVGSPEPGASTPSA